MTELGAAPAGNPVHAALDREDLAPTTRAVLELLLLGLEPAEMARLEVADLRLEGGRHGVLAISPRPTLTRYGVRRRRYVTLSAGARVALERLLDGNPSRSRSLLVSRRGAALSVHGVRSVIARALDDGRHTG